MEKITTSIVKSVAMTLLFLLCSFTFVGQTTVHTADFESGLDSWIDGGANCVRVTNDANSPGGDDSVRLQNDNASSLMDSPTLSLSTYNFVSFEFSFRPQGWDNSSDYLELQYSNNGGSSYSTVGS